MEVDKCALTNRSSSDAALAGTVACMRLRDFRMQATVPYRGVIRKKEHHDFSSR